MTVTIILAALVVVLLGFNAQSKDKSKNPLSDDNKTDKKDM